MIVNLYIDGDQAELLEALADRDEITIEEEANEMFSNLLNKIIEDLKKEYFN